MVKAVIFDMDGTAIESMMSGEQSARRLLNQLHLDTSTINVDDLVSLGWRINAAVINERFHTNFCEKAIRDGYTEIHYNNYRTLYETKPGFIEFLDYLDSRGIKYAIATATRLHGAEDQFERLGLMDRIQFITTEGQVGHTKDYPNIYLSAAERMNAKPSETIVFEDALYAINTSNKAGFRTVGIKEEFFKDDHEEIENKVEVFVEDYYQLLKLIESGDYKI